MSGALVIHVSQLPPASSSPNARVHWSVRYRDAEIYKKAVYYECVQLRNNIEAGLEDNEDSFQPIYRARVDLTFVFKVKRKRDPDNLLARFKPGLDAIVNAGLLSGDSSDRVSFGVPKIVVDQARAPETVIVLTEKRY
jgi:hypothetical protein